MMTRRDLVNVLYLASIRLKTVVDAAEKRSSPNYAKPHSNARIGFEWEDAYYEVFSEIGCQMINKIVANLGYEFEDYRNPDMGYRDDVLAWMSSRMPQIEHILLKEGHHCMHAKLASWS